MEMSADMLVDRLAENLATLIVDHLEAASISEPLIIVDLFYHYADVYFPLVSYLTIDRLRKPLASDGLLFEQKPKIGRSMIRKTAAILNETKLWGRVATHDFFGAFAVDGTVEGHSTEDWEEILTVCGVDAKLRTTWKRLGFF